MVEFDDRSVLVLGDRGPAAPAHALASVSGSVANGVLDDCGVEAAGDMILAWGEAAHDSTIVVDYSRDVREAEASLDPSLHDWWLFVSQDESPGDPTAVIVPRQR